MTHPPYGKPELTYHRECMHCNHTDKGPALVEPCPSCGARTLYITSLTEGQQ